MTATIDSFGIALPAGWIRIPLEDGLFEDHIRNQRALLREHETPLSRTAERQFELMMQQLRNDCQANDVAMLAVLLAPYEGRAASDDQQLDEGQQANESAESELMAVGFTLSTIDRAGLGVDVPLTANTLVAAMGRSVSTERDGVRVVTLETPTVVDLPAGEAVRVVRNHRYRSGPEDGKEVAIYVHHILVPYGGRGDDALVATFCTPTLGHVQSLARLFDEMSTTIRFFSGDDLTDPLAVPDGEPEPVS